MQKFQDPTGTINIPAGVSIAGIADIVRQVHGHAGQPGTINIPAGVSITGIADIVRQVYGQSGQLVGGSAVITVTSPTTLPTDSKDRKNFPLFSGLLRYFPAALAGAARTSKLGNDKHNPGEEMHHARGKSMDHGDCIIRHLMDVEDLMAALNRGDSGATQQAVLDELGSLTWRALALSQEIHEKFGAPLAPGAKK